jgi:hypothetical protein
LSCSLTGKQPPKGACLLELIARAGRYATPVLQRAMLRSPALHVLAGAIRPLLG